MTEVPATDQAVEQPVPVYESVLDEINARIARAVVPEVYACAREKQHDDTVLGLASDLIRRMHVAVDEINAEITPIVERAEAIAARMHELMPDHIESNEEMVAAIEDDETMRTLHAENVALGELVLPLNQMVELFNNIIGAEVGRLFPQARKHPQWAEVQMTKHWEIVVLSPRALQMLHRAAMPAGLQGGDVPVIILRKSAAPVEKKKPNQHLH